MSHSFHIPVLGLGFSVDTPLKVARYGIASTVSIVDDILIERMRKFHSEKNGEVYVPIRDSEDDFRAKRITAYLNLLNLLVDKQIEALHASDFETSEDLKKYFELLPDNSFVKRQYQLMLNTKDQDEKRYLQVNLKKQMVKGAIDVNIMSKVDKVNFAKDGEALPEEFNDALAALRGFANSDLTSSVILSAGMNPRLYSYLESFQDFYPDAQGKIAKKIILKVSDFRSAFIQGKFLAKKGLWVSEFRIESGLNCGGHAFATEGYLMGPILEEFKQNRTKIVEELYAIYSNALATKGVAVPDVPSLKISAQGGIGTSEEHSFLLNYYKMDAAGWGSPFLLVPEVTNVDDETLKNLETASHDDYYLSASSPLGILFNNFKKSTAEIQRRQRIEKGRPGSPCTKKYLVSNTEFTEQPICTASREYQNLKIKELETQGLPEKDFKKQFDKITEKICLCVGLSNSAYIKNDILKPRENRAVAICPGPNLAWFSGSYSFEEMVKHIYGKVNLIGTANRPNMMINELKLYLEYLKEEISRNIDSINAKESKRLEKFKEQMQNGIDYYKQLIPKIVNQTEVYRKRMHDELIELESQLKAFQIGLGVEC